MEATAVHTPIEIHDIVPSVFVALRLISDAHDIGWFLVLVSDVALSFTRYVCGENDIRLTEELSTRSGYAVECLRDFETMSTTHGHVLVNVEELFDLVRIVYTSYLLTTPATRSTWRAINDPTEYAHLLDTQTTIVRLLSVAVVDDMFDRGYDVNDISIVDNIWGEAREIKEDDHANKPGVPRPSVQYTPDETPTEYGPDGDKIPLSEFSVPFEGLQPPDAICPICCFSFLETIGQAIVLARCSGSHPFHEICLDRAVNLGAMENSNRCPFDREVLCTARSRVHLG